MGLGGGAGARYGVSFSLSLFRSVQSSSRGYLYRQTGPVILVVQPAQWLLSLQTKTDQKLSVLGVFARQFIPYKNAQTNRRTCLTPYDGRLRSVDKDVCHDISSHYLSVGCQGLVIDGLREPVIGLGLGSLVNHSERPNADFVKDVVKLTCHLVAIRDILAGEELFVNYGRTYWLRYADGRTVFFFLYLFFVSCFFISLFSFSLFFVFSEGGRRYSYTHTHQFFSLSLFLYSAVVIEDIEDDADMWSDTDVSEDEVN